MPAIYTASTTASSIIAAVSRDVRQGLDSTVSGDQTILLDYVDRVQQELLRSSKHAFLLSDWKYFYTEEGQTDYNLSNLTLANSVTTGLALSDVDRIHSAFDYTSDRELKPTTMAILSPAYTDKGGIQHQQGSPRQYYFESAGQSATVTQPLRLYPAPDSQNTFQYVPPPPIVDTVAGGALTERVYYVKVTWVSTVTGGVDGESTASDEVKVVVPTNSKLVVTSAPTPFTAATSPANFYLDKCNIYASTTSEGTYALQTQISIGSNWTEPGGGLIAGVSYPTTNTLPEVGGYLIGFRYYKQRGTISATATVLQVPDDYKDVVIAGTNYYASRYLKMTDEAALWRQQYQFGIRQIVRDHNLISETADFIRPDPAAL